MASAADGGVTAIDVPTPRPSGRLLAGTLTVPREDAPPSARSSVVLLLHGLLSNKDHNFAPLLADTLSRTLGVHTYRVALRTGPSPEEPEARYRFCGFEEDIDDALCAADMLEKRGLRVVAVVGHSRGGNIALMYGARRRDTMIPLPLAGTESSS
jgi:pimeloyl-ACP methyl ester carboxylesterase